MDEPIVYLFTLAWVDLRNAYFIFKILYKIFDTVLYKMWWYHLNLTFLMYHQNSTNQDTLLDIFCDIFLLNGRVWKVNIFISAYYLCAVVAFLCKICPNRQLDLFFKKISIKCPYSFTQIFCLQAKNLFENFFLPAQFYF